MHDSVVEQLPHCPSNVGDALPGLIDDSTNTRKMSARGGGNSARRCMFG